MPLSYCSYGQSCEMFNEVLVDSFITVYKVVLTFESMDEILKCEHSNESY